MAESIALLPESEWQKILSDLSDDEIQQLEYDWKFWARPNPLEPGGDWQYWLLLAGRGFRKEQMWCRMDPGKGRVRQIQEDSTRSPYSCRCQGHDG